MSDVGTINSLLDIRTFFCTGPNPVPTKEFMEFWTSLTKEEREEFRQTELPKTK